MRRYSVLCLLLTVSVIIFTGCNVLKKAAAPKAPNLNAPFSSSIKITLDDGTELCGEMSRFGTGIWEMKLTSPETVAGLTLSYSEEGVKTTLGELEFDIPADKINSAAVFKMIFDAYDSCAALPDPTLTESENGYEYTGEISACDYVLCFDKEDMSLCAISFPAMNISVETELLPETETPVTETSSSDTEQ